MVRTMTIGARLAFLLALALGVATSAGGQDANANLLNGFRANNDFRLEIDGTVDNGAEIYFQQRLPGYLVLPSKQATPFLVVPRSQSVRAVNIMKVSKQSDGSLDLAPDALFKTLGQFTLDGSTISFDVDGHEVTLREKPPLLGVQEAQALLDYGANYRDLSASYQPAADVIAALRGERRDVKVRIYFGSWCPFCQRYVPRMIRIAKEVADSNIKIDYYGLPHEFSKDTITRTMNIRSVPTGVVFLDGKEIGRIQGDDWRGPEKVLQKLLGG